MTRLMYISLSAFFIFLGVGLAIAGTCQTLDAFASEVWLSPIRSSTLSGPFFLICSVVSFVEGLRYAKIAKKTAT